MALTNQDRLTETQVNGWLESHGMHDAARKAGVYALALTPPKDRAGRVQNNWLIHFEANPPFGFVSRLADASQFVYVGIHGQSIYKRLCQHARGEKSSTIMDAWPPVAIAGVWPDDGEEMEFNRAQELADDDVAVWMDGQLL